jgi:hypothetical protein
MAAQAGMIGNFTGSPEDVIEGIQQIRDPQERENALAAFYEQAQRTPDFHIRGFGGTTGGATNPTPALPPVNLPTTAAVTASPAYQTDSLAAARAAHATVLAEMPNVLSALGVSGDTINAQSVVQQAALQAGGQAAAEATRLQAEETIGQSAVRDDIMHALGMDVRDPDSAIRQLLDRQQQEIATREEMRGRITELKSVSFLENPFAYIMNNVELQKIVPAYNATIDAEADTKERISTLQTAQTSANANTNARSADLIRAKAVQDSKVLAEQATQRLAEAKAGASAATAKIALDKLAVHERIFQDIMAIERLEDAQEARGVRKSAADAKAAEGKRGERLAIGINLYRRMINGNNITDLTRDEVLGMRPEERAMWVDVISRGSFGTYAQAVPLINNVGNIAGMADGGNASMAIVIRNLKGKAEITANAIRDRAKKAGQPNVSQQEALSAAYQQLYESHVSIADKGIDKSTIAQPGSDSPYRINYDAVVATAATPEGQGGLGTQHLALSTWRSALSTWHSALGTQHLAPSTRHQH